MRISPIRLPLFAAVLAVASVAVPPVAHAAVSFQVGTFNMAGGNPEHGPKGDEAPEALVRSVNDRNPAFVTLQEACRDWAAYLDDHLPNHTVKFDPVVDGDGSVARCRHDSDFGNAVLYRNDLGPDVAQAEGHSLDSPARTEQREMLCVRFESTSVTACSVHLTAGGGDTNAAARRTEAERAREFLSTTYAGSTHFVGGDLNESPLSGATGVFYDTGYDFGATGGYKEVDSPCGNDIDDGFPVGGPPYFVFCRDGERTHDDWIFEEGSPVGQKIDFVFVTPTVTVQSADATFAIHSDHDPLWADVSF
ncbi:endonuclease/exonuclease/phosphatase family protein [Amycolatopsis sp. MtRt-6]|uniref:endonuclease/exonuclease/phosphatase family protein n=1 Tax=Amycolatopsis sp. MtRt-6 TaxID=2792782 RepID=UPI001A8EF421|nr:endonuclease/exonuclease/phosphatase family protein [Amycolatopsis sp. MtRt-6]